MHELVRLRCEHPSVVAAYVEAVAESAGFPRDAARAVAAVERRLGLEAGSLEVATWRSLVLGFRAPGLGARELAQVAVEPWRVAPGRPGELWPRAGENSARELVERLRSGFLPRLLERQVGIPPATSVPGGDAPVRHELRDSGVELTLRKDGLEEASVYLERARARGTWLLLDPRPEPVPEAAGGEAA